MEDSNQRSPGDGEADRVGRIASHVRGILGELGLDHQDPNLRHTDERVARLFLEMFSGLDPATAPKVTTFPNEEGYSHGG